MGALMRAYNWDNHPLGNPHNWSHSLKANIRVMLNSSFPMFIWWSEELYQFNNDAYIPALGEKHPESLGARAYEVWAEIWDQIGGITKDVLQSGKQFYTENMQLFLERNGYSEETFWTFSYSPAFNDAGEVEGLFCACNEVTDTVLGQRRLKTLKDISEAMSQSLVLDQAGQTACAIFNENAGDLPFSLIYLTNDTNTAVQLIGKGGELAEALAPESLSLQQTETLWPLQQVRETGQPMLVALPATGDASPQQAAVLPIIRPGQDQVIGYFIAGISPNLAYNEAYKGFFSILAGHIATSITSVQSKQDLIRQQNYLNEIFQQAPVGITILRGPKYIVDIANSGVLEIWGRKKDEVLGRPVLEAIPEVNEQGIKELLDGVMYTGVPFVANELPLVFERNGLAETVYLNFVYHPMRDSQGLITGIIAVAIDISEQVLARKKIEESEARLQAIIEATPECIKIISQDGTLQFMNPSGLEMIEGSAELLGNASVYGVIAPEHRTNWMRNHKRICLGESLNWEFDIVGLKGTRRRMETHAVPLPGTDGHSQLAVTRDVTERKQSEEALELKNAQLTRINNDLDNFIYTASHDLKAPISNIEGLLALLSDDILEGRVQEEETQHIISLMQGSVERFKKTITSLTDVVKLQQENSSETIMVDLEEVVQDVTLDLESALTEADAQLEVDLSGCTAVRFTEKNMRSLVYNILSNAIKYRAPERTPHIQIKSKDTPDYQILSFSDNGLGIETTRTGELFTMFKRFHDHVEGTGIGLYMVKKMVDNAGGYIEVDSQVGTGTTFRIYFKK